MTQITDDMSVEERGGIIVSDLLKIFAPLGFQGSNGTLMVCALSRAAGVSSTGLPRCIHLGRLNASMCYRLLRLYRHRTGRDLPSSAFEHLLLDPKLPD